MTIRSPQSVLMWSSFLAWASTAFAHMSGTQNLLYLQSTFSYNRASSLVMNPIYVKWEVNFITKQFNNVINVKKGTLQGLNNSEIKSCACVKYVIFLKGITCLDYVVQSGKPLHNSHADGTTYQNEAKHHVAGHRPTDYPGLLLLPLEVAAHQVQGPVDQKIKKRNT